MPIGTTIGTNAKHNEQKTRQMVCSTTKNTAQGPANACVEGALYEGSNYEYVVKTAAES